MKRKYTHTLVMQWKLATGADLLRTNDDSQMARTLYAKWVRQRMRRYIGAMWLQASSAVKGVHTCIEDATRLDNPAKETIHCILECSETGFATFLPPQVLRVKGRFLSRHATRHRMSTFAIASFSFCNCICWFLQRLVFLCLCQSILQLHRFRFAIAPRNEDDIPVLSVSLCSLQPECRVNPCVKMKLLGDFNDPVKSRGKVTAKAKTELKQKIMDFYYNRSVTARRGHKKRLAQPGHPNLRAILAWDQALQSATRGLGLAAFQVQKPVPLEQNQKRVFIAMEDLSRALQKRANGRKKRALLQTTLPCGTSERHFEVDWARRGPVIHYLDSGSIGMPSKHFLYTDVQLHGWRWPDVIHIKTTIARTRSLRRTSAGSRHEKSLTSSFK